MEATIRLFRALPIDTKERKVDTKLMELTIRHGFVFAPEVVANYPNCVELIDLVTKTVGLSAEQMNSSFHKSWAKVRDTDIEQLVVEQITHYLTTYGKGHSASYLAEKGMQWGVDDLSDKVESLSDFESDRVGDSDYVYIPAEALNIPDIELDKIRLVVIKGYTKNELRQKLLTLLGSGVALGEDTVQAAVEVAMFVGITDFEGVKNKEVRVVLYDLSGSFPENPTEFLRFAIFKATSTTLLIKSPALISSIRASNNLNIVKVFNDYGNTHGFERLAEIFYRFRPLFLAFRTNNSMKVIVNKIRRLAVGNHKPLPEDFLNLVTAKINRGEKILITTLRSELKKVNTFRKIRLAYALRFRTKNISSIVYRVRNGKGFATGFSFNNQLKAEEILGIVLDAITKDIRRNVKGKKIYIPEHVKYSLPSTEKQFIGNIPSGTYISLPDDMVVGIHWEDVHGRVDLDLSLISAGAGKIGWDRSYRTRDKDILFSGDITDARNGASELFYVKKQPTNAFIMLVNYYNFSPNEVPFKILVAQEKLERLERNHMVNPNNILAITDSVMTKRQKVLGIVTTERDGTRFYFTEADIGSSITSSDTAHVQHSRNYLLGFNENSILLRDVLVMAGAEIVSEKDTADIDLSPESLEKDTILSLLK